MGDGSSHHGRRSYLLRLFHPNRGKEPKLISSAVSVPTIDQTSVMKLLDMEASNPYLKNLPKEDRRDWLVLTSVNQRDEKTGR